MKTARSRTSPPTMSPTRNTSVWCSPACPVGFSIAPAMWRSAMRLPNVHGLVLGRSLLFPRDGDVAANVDRIVEVL